MSKTALIVLLNILKVQSLISRKFDSLSVHGLGLTDYMVLYLLSGSAEQKLRRIDLAEKTGLTASGITRVLNPLEKIGLVSRETNERDARVSYVVLTETGAKVFKEASKTAENVAVKLFPGATAKSLNSINQLLKSLGGDIEPLKEPGA
ncbi:MarR family transcriptional regulator [Chitinophaga caeni]|uniref:MarR family transcriptional regulator n=1 Tax=Chitinophaga caeni TaxID=2029983 RepID=A0A291QWJ7_9BACT|nr:MarR family transcriptional regulator [Chitinophaga caeni]ATL48315.1 MarR family transcriptional regulator [Chitinophaga caeni]